MFYNILDKKRLAILPLLKNFKGDFYLAGGTALALQIGHRDSDDFDFFIGKNIDTRKLFEQIREIFAGRKIEKVQEEKNTLTIIIDENIKISFFTYKYPLLNELINEPYLTLASIDDIACMKLSAIVSRSALKDYVDLYFILQDKKLSELLKVLQKKIPQLDTGLVLKSLVYFDDLSSEKIIFRNDKKVSLNELKHFSEKIVRNFVTSKK
ncbi:MAG TPA: hypothetical protein ENL05_01765, partial [Candidatus Moranbacteria bacterium]|nr:hypothetical protein [Candidatus Moranbacteria bacterium]